VADADAEFERGLDALETAVAVSIEMGGQHFQNQAAEIHTINQPLVSTQELACTDDAFETDT
jgi:hypothetical protein